MVRKSLLKRASYFGSALMLVLATVPIAAIAQLTLGLGSNSALAAPADHCVRNRSSDTLSEYLRDYGEAALCSNIRSSGNSVRITRNVALDLNGYNLNTGIRAGGGSTVTIYATGGGRMNGTLDPGTRGTFVIYGGTFTSNPTAYLADGYEAVRNTTDNSWTVREAIPTITLEKWLDLDENADDWIDFNEPAEYSRVVATSSDTSVITTWDDDVNIRRIRRHQVGDATMTWEYFDDTDKGILKVVATIHVYDINDENEVVMMEGTTITLNDAVFGSFTTPGVIWAEMFEDAEESTWVQGSNITNTTFTAGNEFNAYTVDYYADEGYDNFLGRFTLRVFPKQMVDQIMPLDGEGSEKTIEIETSNFPLEYAYEFISNDENVVSVESDDENDTFTMTAKGVGKATVSVYYYGDDLYGQPMEQFTVDVYSSEISDEVTIPVGTEISLSDGVISRIGNSDIVNVSLDSNSHASLSGTTASGTLTALSAGTATLTFEVGDEVIGTTTVNIYPLQDFEDMVLSVANRNVSVNSWGRFDFTGNNLPRYSVESSDENVATLGSLRNQRCRTPQLGGALNCVNARSAGEATIIVTYDDSLDTTETFKVHVSDYTTNGVSGNHDVAQGGTVNFTISERYDQNSVTVVDDLGFDINKDENGRYTVEVPDDMPGGEYVLNFTDTVAGVEIATQSVTIRVHEIETSPDELYVKVDGEAESLTVREKNNYGVVCGNSLNDRRLGCQYVVRNASGTPSNGVSVRNLGNGEFEVSARDAGEYSIEFTEVMTSGFSSTVIQKKTVRVYAIDFEVEDLEYHIYHTDTAENLIKAINHYWTATSSDGSILYNGRPTRNITVSKEDDENYKFNISRPNQISAGHYTLNLNALIFGDIVDTKTVDIYVYDMTHPNQNVFYGEITDETSEYEFRNIIVDDDLNTSEPGKATITAVASDTENVTVDTENGTVTVKKPGQYVVEYQDTMANGKIASTWTATFNVYGVGAEVEDRILDLNAEEVYTYTIDPAKTYGSVRTTIYRSGPTGSPRRQISRNEVRYSGTGSEVEQLTFDPASNGEGKYTIVIESTSVGRHNLPAIVKEATFYVLAHESEFIVVPQGKTVEVTTSSRWSVDSASAGELDTENKTVNLDTAELPLGVTNVKLNHDFDGQDYALKTATLVVYKINPDESTDPEGITKNTIESVVEEMLNSSLDDVAERLTEVFGEDYMQTVANLAESMFDGDQINTRVSVTRIGESSVEKEMIDAVKGLSANHADYYDVSVLMETDGLEVGKLHKLNDKITVALAKVTDPASGYSRQYFVLRDHNGVVTVLEEGIDFYIKNGTIYVISDEFSTYAVAYKDSKSSEESSSTKSPDTGENTKGVEGAVSTNTITAMITALAGIALVGVAVFAKRR